MRVKKIINEWYQDYKLPSKYIFTAFCDGKCCREAGIPMSVCHNDEWRATAPVKMDDDKIIQEYLQNPITKAIVFGGLEPFEQFEEMFELIYKLRTEYHCDDTVVIYTGYNRGEIEAQVGFLSMFKNIVIKFGRFVPNQESRYDDVLGVTLASPNQYAERIS